MNKEEERQSMWRKRAVMNKENFFDIKLFVPWAKMIWSYAFWPIVTFFIGLWIGCADAELRITSDCKFAQAFRVSSQAFTCQRKI